MTRQHHPALAVGMPQHDGLLARTPLAPRGFDVEACSRAVARWFVEFRCGRRPADQLHAVVDTDLRQRLRELPVDRHGARLEIDPIERVLVQRTTPDRAEAVVLVRLGERTVAVVLAYRREGTRWLVSELSSPELAEPHPEDESPEADTTEPASDETTFGPTRAAA